MVNTSIFFIGDSLTYYNGSVPEILKGLVTCSNNKVLIGSHTQGATSLCCWTAVPRFWSGLITGIETFAKNNKIDTINYVVIQDKTTSSDLIHPDVLAPATYTNTCYNSSLTNCAPTTYQDRIGWYHKVKFFIEQLSNGSSKINKTTTFLIYENMAAINGKHPNQVPQNFEGLPAWLRDNGIKNPVALIPAGSAILDFAKASAVVPIDSQWRVGELNSKWGTNCTKHYSDNLRDVHLSPLASYTVAYMIYRHIFKDDSPNSFNYQGVANYPIEYINNEGYNMNPYLSKDDLLLLQKCIQNSPGPSPANCIIHSKSIPTNCPVVYTGPFPPPLSSSCWISSPSPGQPTPTPPSSPGQPSPSSPSPGQPTPTPPSSPGQPSPSSSSTSFQWWIILLIVGIIVVIVGAALYINKRHNTMKHVIYASH